MAVLADPAFWRVQAEQLWSGFAGPTSALHPRSIRLAWAVGAVLLAGAVAALGRWLVG